MIKNRKFTIIGGDLRNVELGNQLLADKNRVNIYGFNNANFENMLPQIDDLKLAIDESDVIIGPIPCSIDDETVNAPYHDEKIYINGMLKILSKNQLLIAGRISNKIQHLAKVRNVYAIDLLDREEMAVLNAIPTAEGAVQLAMEEMPITLHGSNVIVLGFGRIGKTLAKVLHGIGANVYVEARKYSDIAWIRSYGYKPVYIDDLSLYIDKADVIFNTVPSIILNEDLLKLVNKNCLLIDLASKPGGIDLNKAKDLGLKTFWALSLPGKVAPVTAAGFIKDTIYNILEELGV